MLSAIRTRVINYVTNLKRRAFYRTLVTPGCLVFDIGANRGNRTSVFLSLGAHVVAVEPNPQLASFLSRRFRKNVHVLQSAVGGASGKSQLLINESDVLSTTSRAWLRSVQESGRFGPFGEKFSQSITVDVVTLDEMIRMYGIPQFVKLDVEGAEGEIILNMQDSISNVMSFEFAVPESREMAIRCIHHLNSIGYDTFNLSLGESMEFIVTESFPAEEACRCIDNLPKLSWGDVYALRSGGVNQ